MREVIATCRSRKKARDHVTRVLDSYFWRIGDRTWRGKASNACLDRMSRELREKANRATAVSIQEIRSSAESRMPLIRVGSRSMFSDDGLVPVASHPAAYARALGPAVERNGLAVVRIAALFHDIGKATRLFQEMIGSALRGAPPQASFIRHELFSAVVWDRLFGALDDRALKKSLSGTSAADIDVACLAAIDWLLQDGSPADRPLAFDFLADERRLTFAIGMLILTHHRLPDGDSDHLGIRGGLHALPVIEGARRALEISEGKPLWHEAWWLRRLGKEAGLLLPGVAVEGLDIALRGALVLADHVGSWEKEASSGGIDFLANTDRDKNYRVFAADSLSTHVLKVYRNCRPAFELFHRLRERMPALSEAQMPIDLIRPQIDHPRFSWQMEAAQAARTLAASAEGGFFACLLSGTGTGKTRGAPTILAGAAFGDHRPERRYFRMTLGLGLRVLASQSAREYVDELGFQAGDVRVMIGTPPIEFSGAGACEPDDPGGSESLASVPEWLRIERAEGRVPEIDAPGEHEWLRGLSLDTDRGIPAIVDRLMAASEGKSAAIRSLAESPVIVATVDHLMGVASPTRTKFLPGAIRALTSDLILDEIDQYGPEDIAAIARLVYQSGAAGRRVIVMSATLTRDVGEALHAAYEAGWRVHAAASGRAAHVHLLLTGDAPGSVVVNSGGEAFGALYDACRALILSNLSGAPALRRGEILPPCNTWSDLVSQIDLRCSRMHEDNASEIDGFRVSFGLIRMTRISHTAAIFSQLPSGICRGRLRIKVCLHSNFPRLHRSWIEMRLKSALTRKSADPQAGIRELCRREGIFERATRLGCTDIEIVAVTSPVIETGNDLDFDYAILDPISMRSIIQAAGRVRRHRPGAWPHVNILILGRSPIAMQSKRLAMPGVETDTPSDTGVSRGNLDRFEGRLATELFGEVQFDRIDASPLLSEDIPCPLRDAEGQLRRAMLRLSGEAPPLGRYLERSIARLNVRFARSRMFRRSTTSTLRYALSGDGLEDAVWVVDVSRGNRIPVWRPPSRDEIHYGDNPGDDPDGYLFLDILKRAWRDYAGIERSMTDGEMKRLVAVDIPAYDIGNTVLPVMTCREQTGFTRNTPEDLSEPFGSAKQNQ